MSPWSRRTLVAVLVTLGALVVTPASLATHAVGPGIAAPISSSAGVGASPLSTGAFGAHPAPDLRAPTLGARALAAAAAAHVSSSKVFLPNFNAHPTFANGTVQPLYTTAPAPMGIGDFGLQDVNGTNVGTISYTNSIEGAMTLNSITPLYLDGAGPDQFTVQLNTVLTNVDLLGNLSNQFWIQNVPVYYANSQTLAFEDNIWNFSSPAFNFDSTSIWAHGPGGFIIPGVVYIGVGPAFHVPMPFTVTVYNNASIVNDRPTIFFNYSITASNGSVTSGSFDYATFNSTGLATPTGPSPMPTFQINGVSAGNTNFLLNDAEIMLGGPGGGSNTNIYAIDGSMGLWTLPNGTSTYQSVPAAFDFGTDTGETSDGIAEWATSGPNPVVNLVSGPSLLYPLWGLAGSMTGVQTTVFHVTPPNAFVFVSAGATFNTGTAAWAPLDPNGDLTVQLPVGTWSAKILLSDYDWVSGTLPAGGSVTIRLNHDTSMGLYTPLWAWGNAQLHWISKSGTGNESNPYVLANAGVGVVDPLFGEFSDYFFPVFAGIQLVDTSAFVSVIGEPELTVAYTLPYEGAIVSSLGLPSTNELEYNLYNASRVSILDATISGWFWNAAAGELFGNVILWNSSQCLIANNLFDDASTALIQYGGTANVIFGNTFAATTPVAANPGAILYTGQQIGMWLFESGDLIYNNWFGVTFNAYTPGQDIYNGAPAYYHDTWNVPVQPASNVRDMNGHRLTGSILGLSWQGGNFWNDYGSQFAPYGSLPYRGGGLIYAGGDFAPLTSGPLSLVLFQEVNLPSGTSWSVTFDGITKTSTTAYIHFWDLNGTYAWTVAPVTGFTSNVSSGAAIVAGSPQLVQIHWK